MQNYDSTINERTCKSVFTLYIIFGHPAIYITKTATNF